MIAQGPSCISCHPWGGRVGKWWERSHPVNVAWCHIACSRLSVVGDERKRGRTKARSSFLALVPPHVFSRFLFFSPSLTTESLEQARCHMLVKFVLGSRLSEGFPPVSPVYLPPQNPTSPNSSSTMKTSLGWCAFSTFYPLTLVTIVKLEEFFPYLCRILSSEPHTFNLSFHSCLSLSGARGVFRGAFFRRGLVLPVHVRNGPFDERGRSTS